MTLAKIRYLGPLAGTFAGLSSGLQADYARLTVRW